MTAIATVQNGTPSRRAEFMAGVQHAASMLAEAERIQAESSKCPTAIEIEFLEGKPQYNFVAAYLQRICAEPQLVEGFAAVLSDYFAMPTSTDGAYYAELTEQQVFEQGVGGGQ